MKHRSQDRVLTVPLSLTHLFRTLCSEEGSAAVLHRLQDLVMSTLHPHASGNSGEGRLLFPPHFAVRLHFSCLFLFPELQEVAEVHPGRPCIGCQSCSLSRVERWPRRVTLRAHAASQLAGETVAAGAGRAAGELTPLFAHNARLIVAEHLCPCRLPDFAFLGFQTGCRVASATVTRAAGA